jgi:sensor histidine kinase regulating citrate/malate metabolism
MNNVYFRKQYKSIKNRVKLYSGKLTLKSKENKGCKLEVYIPVEQNPQLL